MAKSPMLWRQLRQFWVWAPLSAIAAYGAMLAIAAQSSGPHPPARAFLANQFVMLEAIYNAPYLLLWGIFLFIVWDIPFLWAGRKLEAAERAARPVPVERQELKQPAPRAPRVRELAPQEISAIEQQRAERIADRTSFYRGVMYGIFREWDHALGEMTEDDQFLFLGNITAFLQQAAIDGSITIWGMPQGRAGGHFPIKQAVWEEQQIDNLSVHPFHGRKAHTQYTGIIREHPIYTNLSVRESEIENLFRGMEGKYEQE